VIGWGTCPRTLPCAMDISGFTIDLGIGNNAILGIIIYLQ